MTLSGYGREVLLTLSKLKKLIVLVFALSVVSLPCNTTVLEVQFSRNISKFFSLAPAALAIQYMYVLVEDAPNPSVSVRLTKNLVVHGINRNTGCVCLLHIACIQA